MSINVGSVEVTVVPDARKFNDLLGPQINASAKQAGEKFGDDFTASVQGKVKKSKPVDMPTPDTKKSDAEIDRFLRDFNAKMKKQYDKTGQDSGNALANGLRLSFLRNSPLIAAAVGGGLILGAPAAIAGAGVLFAGVAAVAEKNNVQLQASAKATGAAISGVFSQAAEVTVPMFTGALGRISAAVTQLEPQLHSAFSALGAPIDSLTTGVLALVQNAMPGLVSALRNAGPVFAGLSSLLSELGTGLGQFFQLVSQHGAAAGQVFSSLGQILGAALPILGRLIDVGVQLGSQVLPPVASALGLVAKALGLAAPILPTVVAGLGGLMIARALQGPLQTLAQNLAFASYNGGTFAGAAGKMSTAVSGLSTSLPIAGFVLGTFMEVQQRATDQAREWAQALLDGGQAAETAQSQMSNLGVAMRTTNSGFEGIVTGLVGFGAQASVTANALSQVKDQQKQLTDSMSPLEKAQQAVTKAQNDYLTAVQKWGVNSGQAVGAADALRDAQDHLTTIQGQLNAVTGTGTGVLGNFKGQLQTTADTASAANTQLNLLKGSLDALTGKTVSMTEAQIAVSQATMNAVQSVQNQTGALVVNGDVMNTHTARSDAAMTALIALAGSSNQLIATMEQQGATTDQVTQKDGQLRDSFIHTAEQMGYTKGQAQQLADQIYGIPSQRNVQINTNAADARAAIKTVQDQIDNLHGRNVTIKILSAGNAGPAAYAVPGSSGGYARGGVIPGYAPGVDSVHAMLSPGEGVLVPEAVRGIGGAVGVEALNAAFSSRVPGFAAGGVVPVNVYETASPFNDALQSAANKVRDQMSTVSGVPSSRGANVLALLRAAAQYGWNGGAEWSALNSVEMREAGYNNVAQNPTSTAYGMPQFLNSTWATVGLSKTSDPDLQSLGRVRYIKQRYGDPIGAWAHETRYGWYDQGGMVPPGPSLVYNGTSGSEHMGILTNQQWATLQTVASGGGRGDVNGMVFNAPVEIKDTDAMLARSFRQAAVARARFQ